jgi:hypothetical protein
VIALFWLLVLAVAAPVAAQGQFTASVDHANLRVGETVNLTLTFDGASSGLGAPQLSSLGNLQVAGGPFTSTNVSIVNGRISSSASFTYALRALQAGHADIGPAKLTYKGKTYTTAPISLNVLAAGSASGSPGSPGARGGSDARGAGDIFLRVVPDKTVAYVGEQITLTYKIYFSVQMTNPELVQLPHATGFWVEDISLPQQAVLTDEVVSGRAYKVAVIRKSALFPTTDGDLEVEPLVVATKIERRTRRMPRDPFDIFNDPFFQLGTDFQPVQVQSPTVKLKIRPLPTASAPAGFAGAVGSFNVRSQVDRMQGKTDEAVTLIVQISGTGNIKMLPEPVFSLPADVQRFDPETSEDIRRNQMRINGTKTFKYVLIPRAPGVQVIPAVTYAFFDPERAKFTTTSAPEIRLLVEKGSGTGVVNSNIPVAAKRGVESVGTDISFAKMQPGVFVSRLLMPHQEVSFWVLTTVPWMALAGMMIGIRRRESLGAVKFARRSALRQAARHVRQAEKAHKSIKLPVAVKAISAALDSCLLAAIGPAVTAMPDDALREAWATRNLSAALLEEILDLRAECDRFQYAASLFSGQDIGGLVTRAKNLTAKFDRTPLEVRAA